MFLNLPSSHLRNFSYMHNNTQTPNEKKCFLSPLFFFSFFTLHLLLFSSFFFFMDNIESLAALLHQLNKIFIFFSKKSSINIIIFIIFYIYFSDVSLTCIFYLSSSLSSLLHIYTTHLIHCTQQKDIALFFQSIKKKMRHVYHCWSYSVCKKFIAIEREAHSCVYVLQVYFIFLISDQLMK